MTPPASGTEANRAMVQLTRLARGWSKQQLADAAGVSGSHVSRVESGALPVTDAMLVDYAQALQCPPAALCVPFTISPALCTCSRAQHAAAEWKRDRVWARANLIAMRLGRLTAHADIEPVLALPELDPTDGPDQQDTTLAAHAVRRLWRLTSPIHSMIGLLEAAAVFVVSEDFCDPTVDAVTLRANHHHPHLVYVNAALPEDRMPTTLAQQLGHLVMDAVTPASPAQTHRRAATFAAEFLAPIDAIAADLHRVSEQTIYELDELQTTWGVPLSALVVRAREHGILTDHHYRAIFRRLNETGRMHPRPAFTEQPQLVAAVLTQLSTAGYTNRELDDITLLTHAQRTELFHLDAGRPRVRHLAPR